MRNIIMSAVVLLVSTGCFRTIVRTGAPRGDVEGDSIGVTLLYGVLPVNVNASRCKYGLHSIETGVPVWGALVLGLTSGLIAPMETNYVCAAAPSERSRPRHSDDDNEEVAERY